MVSFLCFEFGPGDCDIAILVVILISTITPRPRNAAMIISITRISFPEVFNDLKDAGYDDEAGEEDYCYSK